MYYKDSTGSETNCETVTFEFYCVKAQYPQTNENLDTSSSNDEEVEIKPQMDFEDFWSFIMRIVTIFEDMISNQPSNKIFSKIKCIPVFN